MAFSDAFDVSFTLKHDLEWMRDKPISFSITMDSLSLIDI